MHVIHIYFMVNHHRMDFHDIQFSIGLYHIKYWNLGQNKNLTQLDSMHKFWCKNQSLLRLNIDHWSAVIDIKILLEF